MQTEFSFLKPEQLLWLLLIPLLAWSLLRFEKSRELARALLGFSTRTNSEVVRSLIAPLVVCGLALLAFARPYSGFQEITLPKSGRDYMFIVDVSLSMMTRDVSPSRMVAARRKIEDAINLVAKYSPGDRFGIVLFSGQAYLYCPLTADYSVLKAFTKSISPELITARGSSITSAIETALNSFSSAKAEHPELILISDGEDDQFQVEQVINKLTTAKIKLYALGVGTTEGKPIEIQAEFGQSQFVRDKSGQIVISKLNDKSLQKIANASGGKYFPAGIGDSDLRAIFNFTTMLNKRQTVGQEHLEKMRIYREVGPYLVWLCCLIFLIAAIRGRLPALFFWLLIIRASDCSNSAFAQDSVPSNTKQATTMAETPNIRQSYLAYEDGDYAQAKRGFEHYLNQYPNDLKAKQSLASALYKLGKFEDAQKLFSELKQQATSGRQKFEASYDEGNALLQAKQFDKAIKSYEEALKIKDRDPLASYNLELAKKLLQEKQKQEQQNKDQKDQQKDKNQEQQKSDPNQQSSPQDPHNDPEKNSQSSPSPQPTESASPNPSATGEQQSHSSPTASASASPSPGSQESGADSPSPSSSPGSESDQKSPSPSPSASPTSSSPQPSPKSEQDQSPEGKGDVEAGTPLPEHDPQALKQQEADAWLESLPDSPVLLRQKRGRNSNSEQYW